MNPSTCRHDYVRFKQQNVLDKDRSIDLTFLTCLKCGRVITRSTVTKL